MNSPRFNGSSQHRLIEPIVDVVEGFGGCSPPECLTGPVVECQCDGVDLVVIPSS